MFVTVGGPSILLRASVGGKPHSNLPYIPPTVMVRGVSYIWEARASTQRYGKKS